MDSIEIYINDKRFVIGKRSNGNWLLQEFAIIDVGFHNLIRTKDFKTFGEAKYFLTQTYPELLEVK